MELPACLHSYLNKSYGGKLKMSESENSGRVVFADLEENQTINFFKAFRKDEYLPEQSLISICCLDYPHKEKRFELIYNILILGINARLILKTRLKENAIAPSITEFFPNAGWYEREIWDFSGVLFSGNDDMRRIITDYGFVGHPMRKDFPLTGHLEVSYDETLQKVHYSPVSLQKDFPNFAFHSQWNDDDVLPGDEKVSKNKP